MKLALVICLVALATAAPQHQDKDAQIVLEERSDSADGNFYYQFETSNGISEQRRGTPGSEGQSNMDGAFRFRLLDGTIAEVRYVANEYGYQPESDLIPTPHPLPPHAIEQIRVAEEQRRQSITFDK
ncbi:cuticle protein AMP1B-like [Cherax quadricarinatus]|uniref:cuticle protein AMP1B-like n=1 Tax=Cherax quadricarinatus TaxID=27406 RepID=UPI0023782EE9|nr:cuticle protein AMP1B-like [Cherax quadricarinatus]